MASGWVPPQWIWVPDSDFQSRFRRECQFPSRWTMDFGSWTCGMSYPTQFAFLDAPPPGYWARGGLWAWKKSAFYIFLSDLQQIQYVMYLHCMNFVSTENHFTIHYFLSNIRPSEFQRYDSWKLRIMGSSNPASWGKRRWRSTSVTRQLPLMAISYGQLCGSQNLKAFLRRGAELLTSDCDIAQMRQMKRSWNGWRFEDKEGVIFCCPKIIKNIWLNTYYHLHLSSAGLSLPLSLVHPGIGSGRTTCQLVRNAERFMTTWTLMCQGFNVSQLRHQVDFYVLFRVFFVQSIQKGSSTDSETQLVQNYVCWWFPILHLSVRKESICLHILSYTAGISASEETILAHLSKVHPNQNTIKHFFDFLFGFCPPPKSN